MRVIYQKVDLVSVASNIKLLQVSSFNTKTGDITFVDISTGASFYQSNAYVMPFVRAPKPGDIFLCAVDGKFAIPIGSHVEKYKLDKKLDFIPYDARAIVINNLNYLLMAIGLLDIRLDTMQLTLNAKTGTFTSQAINYKFYAGKNKVIIDGKTGEITIENSAKNDPAQKEIIKIEDSKITLESINELLQESVKMEMNRNGTITMEVKNKTENITTKYDARAGKMEIKISNGPSIVLDKTKASIENNTGGKASITLKSGGIIELNASNSVVVKSPTIALPANISTQGASGKIMLPSSGSMSFDAFFMYLRQLTTWLSSHVHMYVTPSGSPAPTAPPGNPPGNPPTPQPPIN